MSTSAEQLYQHVCQHARQATLWTTVESALGWDERTMLPPAAGAYRAEQLTAIAGLLHHQWTDPQFVAELTELADGPLAKNQSSDAAVNIRRLKRRVDKKVKLPQRLVEELAGTAVLGQQAWQQARQNDDFPSFRPLLEKTIVLKREQAQALGYPQCPYDALLDDFEPEELTANVGSVLADLREQLVPLVAAISASGRRPERSIFARQYPLSVQEAFGRQAAAAIGLDFNRSRLDVTAHPFCTTLGPHDVRITTHYHEHAFNRALFSILHESGHALYEQGLPPEQFGLPLGEMVSLGIHESQSRLWENLVGAESPILGTFLPPGPAALPGRLGRRWAGRLLLRLERRAAFAHPHRGRRGHLQPAHPPAFRA